MNPWEVAFIEREVRRLKEEEKKCKHTDIQKTIKEHIVFLETVVNEEKEKLR